MTKYQCTSWRVPSSSHTLTFCTVEFGAFLTLQDRSNRVKNDQSRTIGMQMLSHKTGRTLQGKFYRPFYEHDGSSSHELRQRQITVIHNRQKDSVWNQCETRCSAIKQVVPSIGMKHFLNKLPKLQSLARSRRNATPVQMEVSTFNIVQRTATDTGVAV